MRRLLDSDRVYRARQRWARVLFYLDRLLEGGWRGLVFAEAIRRRAAARVWTPRYPDRFRGYVDRSPEAWLARAYRHRARCARALVEADRELREVRKRVPPPREPTLPAVEADE